MPVSPKLTSSKSCDIQGEKHEATKVTNSSPKAGILMPTNSHYAIVNSTNTVIHPTSQAVNMIVKTPVSTKDKYY